jgi:hypothetical protein
LRFFTYQVPRNAKKKGREPHESLLASGSTNPLNFIILKRFAKELLVIASTGVGVPAAPAWL